MRSSPIPLSISRLVDDHADVVLARPDQASASERFRAREVLDETERARAARFVFERDRELFIFSHGLLRLTLARYLGADARELRFTNIPGGRPELDVPGCQPLRFNLSHTDGLVACMVTRSAECGVDVESIRHVDYRDLFPTVLAASELSGLMALDEGCRRNRFLEIWTLKEAYLKGRGLGLSYPLNKIAFAGFDNGKRRLTVDPDVDGSSRAWHFWSSSPTSWHRAAAALRTDERAAVFCVIEAEVIP